MKSTVKILGLIIALSIAVAACLDEPFYRRLGFSWIGTNCNIYPDLPGATKFDRYDFYGKELGAYSLQIVWENSDGERFYHSYPFVDCSGEQIIVTPEKILEYAYSKEDLYIQLTDTANQTYWIKPTLCSSPTTTYPQYENVIVAEHDIKFSALRVINPYSWGAMVIMLGYVYCVSLAVGAMFVLILFALAIFLISLRKEIKAGVYKSI